MAMEYFNHVRYHGEGRDERSFTPHIDNAVEILQTWSEGGHFLIKDHIYPIQTAGIYLINSIDIHCSNPSDVDSYVRSKIVIDHGYFMDVVRLLGLEEQITPILEQGGCAWLPRFSIESVFYKVDRLLQRFNALYGSDAYLRQAKLCHLLEELLLMILDEIPPSDVPGDVADPKTDRILNVMTSYIKESLNEELSLDKMCADLHMSKSAICHLFKKSTGLSVMQYATSLRLSQAKKLLSSTNLKIQDISAMLGFSSSTVFCSTFRKHIGVSPQKYRDNDQLVSQPAFLNVE